MTRHFKTEADLILDLVKLLEAQADYLTEEEDENAYREWIQWLMDKYEYLPGE